MNPILPWTCSRRIRGELLAWNTGLAAQNLEKLVNRLEIGTWNFEKLDHPENLDRWLKAVVRIRVAYVDRRKSSP
jgi:hypothetical protein